MQGSGGEARVVTTTSHTNKWTLAQHRGRGNVLNFNLVWPKFLQLYHVQKRLALNSIHDHWLEARLRKVTVLPLWLVVLAVSRPPSSPSQHVTSDGGCDGGTQYQHDLAWDRAPPAASVSEPLVTCYATLTTRKHKISVYIWWWCYFNTSTTYFFTFRLKGDFQVEF